MTRELQKDFDDLRKFVIHIALEMSKLQEDIISINARLHALKVKEKK